MDKQRIKKQVINWLQNTVIGLNLCPFAKKSVDKNAVRYHISTADTEQLLLDDLLTEMKRLDNNPSIETSLLIHPKVLSDFQDYNQFLDRVDDLIMSHDYEGVYQIASFHPQYQFDGTDTDDNENYTNRSPYPLLHVLREHSLEKALDYYPDPETIPERNIERLNSMTKMEIMQLFTPNTESGKDT